MEFEKINDFKITDKIKENEHTIIYEHVDKYTDPWLEAVYNKFETTYTADYNLDKDRIKELEEEIKRLKEIIAELKAQLNDKKIIE